MKRTRLVAPALCALMIASPVLAQDIIAYRNTDGVNRTDVSAANPLPTTAGALSASGVTSATTTLASATEWHPTFAYVAGRTFYLTLGGSGSGPVTVVYSRDAWATAGAPEVAGVDASAPIVMNKITYAGSPVIIPLSVSEANVKVGLLPGTITGTVTAALSQ